MTIRSFYVRNMLHNYDKQLIAARRLNRYLQAMRGDAGDSQKIPAEVKRKVLVERVAHEVMENLVFSGSDNPIVQDVKTALEQELGERFSFKFPVEDLSFQVYRETQSGPEKVENTERLRILDRLWSITLDKVDQTML